MSEELNRVRDCWDSKAADWKIQVGEFGDQNRQLNSDPVLFELLGETSGLTILDVGCGTGYLVGLLMKQHANVIGVDVSSEMIAIASRDVPAGDFRVDDSSQLATVEDQSIDKIVSNYVLMDTPDLDRTVEAMFRVLKPGGTAVLIFSHPCFPQGPDRVSVEDRISYHWAESYFDQQRRHDRPWNHFQTEFIWYHRPISDYFQSFRRSGFAVDEMREPRIPEDWVDKCSSPEQIRSYRERPMSIAFRLIRPRD
ncbi:methyltransferase domain-containing protein [Thalassoglobus sp. JC818]|uniref:class I SAM-dependent methyltransferase n=1 Tax=Thalassoglobus sp. JC818 TaxID=3232136 RepID=UPI00345AF45A